MTVELIANALLYGLILSAVLGIVMLVSFLVAPDMWVGDYPPDIKAKYGEMGARTRRVRPLFALLFFGSIIVIVMLSLRSLQAMAQSDVGFWASLVAGDGSERCGLLGLFPISLCHPDGVQSVRLAHR
jgi:ACR3 family arsenite efflux pump ArsB